MPKPENAYSLDMEKKLRAIDSMILQEAESFTVEMSGSMKQNWKRYRKLMSLTQEFLVELNLSNDSMTSSKYTEDI